MKVKKGPGKDCVAWTLVMMMMMYLARDPP